MKTIIGSQQTAGTSSSRRSVFLAADLSILKGQQDFSKSAVKMMKEGALDKAKAALRGVVQALNPVTWAADEAEFSRLDSGVQVSAVDSE